MIILGKMGGSKLNLKPAMNGQAKLRKMVFSNEMDHLKMIDFILERAMKSNWGSWKILDDQK